MNKLTTQDAPLVFGPPDHGAITLAFYKGRGHLFDRLVRFATRSPYSHVELIVDAPAGPQERPFTASAVSASPRDGGVRQKRITFDPRHWNYITLPDWPYAPRDRILLDARKQAGFGYDYAGIIFTFAIPLRREASGRYFCSELIGEALRLPEPHTLAPGDLHHWVLAVSEAYAEGCVQDAPCCAAALNKSIQAVDEWDRNGRHGNPADEVRIALHEARTACAVSV